MLVELSLALGAITVVFGGVWLFRRRSRGADADRRQSKQRHREAQQREPPVDVGDEHLAGIEDFSTHHSGERHAICRVEGFVVFVEELPTDVDVGDVIRFRILSYNRGHTSASAMFVSRA